VCFGILHSSVTVNSKTKVYLVSTKQRLIRCRYCRQTKNYLNQTKLSAEAKLSTTLLDVAQANELQVTKLCPKDGILLAYHPALKRKAILTYSTNFGIKVWYWHDNPEEEVTDPVFLKQ
jgi:hypothetical protein